jgi:RNA recognition motif-containing protein
MLCSLLSHLRLLAYWPANCPQSGSTNREKCRENLFVGNPGSEVTHEELRRLFEAYGQVEQVHIIVDRDTGLPRGFAFVEMTNDADVEKAIKAVNGSILRDRTLNVNYARPRPERPAA